MGASSRPKIGLVLGGGGARGLAHIGVLKVFERKGIPIDILAGTSMGGIIAGAYAAGISSVELEAEAERLTHVSSIMRLVDLSGPHRGLIEGKRLRVYLCERLGRETAIENLPIPLALPAVDLVSGQQVVLRQGLLVDAVQATMAVPGLFSPVYMGDYQLCDGGLLNNIPVDVARGMGADITVAVDVSPSYLQNPSDSGETAGEVWPAWFPTFARDFYIAELIMVSALTEIHLREARPEIIIRPTLPPGISVFWGFSRAAEAIQAGEKAALDILPDLEELLKS